jgi:hypothetical protein
VDEHGVQLANRNPPNDSAELVGILGRLEPGTPVASRPPTAGAG